MQCLINPRWAADRPRLAAAVAKKCCCVHCYNNSKWVYTQKEKQGGKSTGEKDEMCPRIPTPGRDGRLLKLIKPAVSVLGGIQWPAGWVQTAGSGSCLSWDHLSALVHISCGPDSGALPWFGFFRRACLIKAAPDAAPSVLPANVVRLVTVLRSAPSVAQKTSLCLVRLQLQPCQHCSSLNPPLQECFEPSSPQKPNGRATRLQTD